MSGTSGGASGGGGQPPAVPDAVTRRRRRFSLVWMIPVVAGLIAIYLIVTTLTDRGPLITITFKTGSGLTAQQTEVKHKDVALGMVENVHLAKDFRSVVVHIRMKREGERVLTDHARFWVVRPRLSTGNISGLETLVSGAFIEVDPGDPGGKETREFTGLEDPPGVKSDEPGRSFVLKAVRLGSLGPGAPVFYRDVSVGEVLGYDLGDGLGPVTINVFVRDPYAKFVHAETHFWNASGLTVTLGGQGIHAEVESLQALLSGGIAFETPQFATKTEASPQQAEFHLYVDKEQADAAGFRRNIPLVSYFTSSVSGLTRGAAVTVFGIQVGTVNDVKLLVDPNDGSIRTRVAYDVQPERFTADTQQELQSKARRDPKAFLAEMVKNGLRATLESSSFITGQKAIALGYMENPPHAEAGSEGDAIVLPSQGGGLDNIMGKLSDITNKIAAMPFEDIGKNLDALLASANKTIGGPDVRNALQKLSETLTDVQHLVRHADAGLDPVLKKLPRMSEDLQQSLAKLNGILGEGGYGGNSDFQRNASRLLDQVNDTARSIRLLVDFLDRHPEALIRGRTNQATER